MEPTCTTAMSTPVPRSASTSASAARENRRAASTA